MKVSELIEKLKLLPQDATIYKTEGNGCSECDPDVIGSINDVYQVSFYEEGPYLEYVKGKRCLVKNVVVL